MIPRTSDISSEAGKMSKNEPDRDEERQKQREQWEQMLRGKKKKKL